MSSQTNWTILKHFSGRGVYGFSPRQVAEAFPEKNTPYLCNVLADMVDRGMLCRVSRDRYRIIPLESDPVTYVPDGYQVACDLMLGKAYYIGYLSALEKHGIMPRSGTRTSLTDIFLVVAKQVKPSIRSYGGINYHFICPGTPRFFGFGERWINAHEKALIGNLEKTVVDMATMPQHGGGIIELGHVLYQVYDRMDLDKLFYTLARNGAKAAKKRVLFLIKLMGLAWSEAHDLMEEELGSGYVLLDPHAPGRGPYAKKHGLIVNVDPEEIRKAVL